MIIDIMTLMKVYILFVVMLGVSISVTGIVSTKYIDKLSKFFLVLAVIAGGGILVYESWIVGAPAL